MVPVEFSGPAYAAEVRLARRLQMLGDLGQSGVQVEDVPDQAVRFPVVVPPPRLGGAADQFVQLQLDTQGVISGPHQRRGTRFRHPPITPATAPAGHRHLQTARAMVDLYPLPAGVSTRVA